MMPGLPELLVVLVIILVLFGAGRLPEVFEAFGSGIKRFRTAQREGEEEDILQMKEAPKEIPDNAAVSEAEEVPTNAEAVPSKAAEG